MRIPVTPTQSGRGARTLRSWRRRAIAWRGLLAVLLSLLMATSSGCVRFRGVGPGSVADAAPAAGAGPARIDPELARLLTACRQARERGDIDRPEHDNALGWLQHAMRYRPGDPLVREERQQVLRAGVVAALELGRRHQFQDAERLLTRLQRHGLQDRSIRHARQRLNRMYSQRAVDLIPPANLVGGSEPDLSGWLEAQLASYKSYTGWVDLYAPSDRMAIALYRQLQQATPDRNWRVRLLRDDRLLFRLHYQIH